MAFFSRIEVQNNVNYGARAGYLLGEHAGIQFMWNYNRAGTLAQFSSGGPDTDVFNVRTPPVSQPAPDAQAIFRLGRPSRLYPGNVFNFGQTYN